MLEYTGFRLCLGTLICVLLLQSIVATPTSVRCSSLRGSMCVQSPVLPTQNVRRHVATVVPADRRELFSKTSLILTGRYIWSVFSSVYKTMNSLEMNMSRIASFSGPLSMTL